jgi:Putative prokaryotic signal transducing protein
LRQEPCCRVPDVARANLVSDNPAMEELIRTNDLVLISYVEALFREAGIAHLVLDTHMSVLEGSLGIIPRRILVSSDEIAQARRVIRDAGLEHELRPS